jgi:hypothetical protein
MKYLLLAGNLLSGIGQVMARYKLMLDQQGHETTLLMYSDDPSTEKFDMGFAFLLPLPNMIHASELHLRNCERVVRMTVCETETVHENYALFLRYKRMYVPSMFALNVLRRQFPEMKLELLRHWADRPSPTPSITPRPYTFYTIGNVADFRKNITTLVNTFVDCKFPNARLVLKATCKAEIKINAPNVIVINGLLSEPQLNRVHDSCDCYVNCSHSEGVGMGCVEAAMRNKPVILSEYGGAAEYVHTPWVIPCSMAPVGRDEFLFKRDMMWGAPDQTVLKRHMHDCYYREIMNYDHTHTHDIMKELVSRSIWYFPKTIRV